jgi:hypothetical protein
LGYQDQVCAGLQDTDQLAGSFVPYLRARKEDFVNEVEVSRKNAAGRLGARLFIDN